MTELTRLIEETAGLVTGGSNVRCVFDFKDGRLYADVDETRLTQAVRHILQDTVQAMPGGGTLKIGAIIDQWPEVDGHEAKQGYCARLTFLSPGEGSSAHDLKKRFDPDFAGRHDGLIVVDSRVGSDTAFHIYLPLASPVEDPMEDLEDDSMYIEDLPVVTGRGRILVMDDEAFIRELAEEMLVTLGYEAVLVNDGEEAVAAYKAAIEAGERFDLVILDLTVPDAMGGLEAMEQLLAVDPDVKGIISSGYSNDPVMSDFHTHGFQGAVQKPYRVQDIDDALNRLLHK